jgi:hypothetical protein
MCYAVPCQYRQLGAAARAKQRASGFHKRICGSWPQSVAGVLALLIPMWVISTGSAQSSGPAVPVGPDVVNCEDRLRLDRRDDPQNAIRNFRQCGASQSVSANIENVTFWYVTSSSAAHDFRFQTAWKNNLAILTGQFVAFTPEKAVRILDGGIVRGLERGKRQDLVEPWLATHNPEVLATVHSGEGQKRLTNPATSASIQTVPAKRAAEKSSANVARSSAGRRDRTRRASRVHQGQRGYEYPYAYSDFDSESAIQLNRAQLETTYEQTTASATFHTETYQPPSAAAVPQPQVPSQYAPVARQQAFPQSESVQQSFVQPAIPQQYHYPTIPQQVEKNIRTITGLIEENIRTVQYNLFGPIGP